MNTTEAFSHYIDKSLDDPGSSDHSRNTLASWKRRIGKVSDKTMTSVLEKAGYNLIRNEVIWSSPGDDHEYAFLFPYQGRILYQVIEAESEEKARDTLRSEFAGVNTYDSSVIIITEPSPTAITDAANQIISSFSFT